MTAKLRCLITGASGFIGSSLATAFAAEGWEVCAMRFRNSLPGALRGKLFSEHAVDLVDTAAIETIVRKEKPSIIIHAAALANVSECEEDPSRADRENVAATESILRAAESIACDRFLYLSTDMVFEGSVCPPGGFTESDRPVPLTRYSRSKFQAECIVLGSTLNVTILRISLTYGPGRRNFLGWVRTQFESSSSVSLFTDEFRTPIAVSDLGAVSLALAKSPNEIRLLHAGGPERVSRVEFGMRAAEIFNLKKDKIQKVSRLSFPGGPPRPHDLSLSSAALRAQLELFPSPLDVGLRRAESEDSWW